ncbi:MAG: family 10 glycosylhydrolase [Planctomycetia bacterium]|nr:family 10 glycosylhydrolase [Planctomycetia bacterium]
MPLGWSRRSAWMWLLLSNRRDGKPATFGKIRVLAGPTHLPPATIDATPRDVRLLSAYYDKPLCAENFSAPESLDESTQQDLADWNTFYTGGVRLVEYLKHVGYNSAIISVSRDGATIYPSRLLDSTPRYDSGTLFVSGQDLQQKDVLEMLFRLFDREQLQLIPSFHFATPLPELDALQLGNSPATTGIELLGYDGRPWPARFGTNRGQAPYYNPLDPRVQNAVRRVIGEVVDRYAHHSSFAGVSLQMSPDTFVQLPGAAWGNDDRTIARFTADTKTPVPSENASGDELSRYRDRAKFELGCVLCGYSKRCRSLTPKRQALSGNFRSAGEFAGQRRDATATAIAQRYVRHDVAVGTQCEATSGQRTTRSVAASAHQAADDVGGSSGRPSFA